MLRERAKAKTRAPRLVLLYTRVSHPSRSPRSCFCAKKNKKINFTSAANWLIEFHQRIEWVFSFKFKVGLLSHLSLNIITWFYYPLSLSLWFTKLTTWRTSPPRIKLEYEWARRNMSSTPRPRARNGNTWEKNQYPRYSSTAAFTAIGAKPGFWFYTINCIGFLFFLFRWGVPECYYSYLSWCSVECYPAQCTKTKPSSHRERNQEHTHKPQGTMRSDWLTPALQSYARINELK